MCILFVKVSRNIEHEQFTTLWAINSILFYLYSDKSYVKRTLHPPEQALLDHMLLVEQIHNIEQERWLEWGTVPLSSQCSPLFSAGSPSVGHGRCYWKGEALKTSWAMQHCKCKEDNWMRRKKQIKNANMFLVRMHWCKRPIKSSFVFSSCTSIEMMIPIIGTECVSGVHHKLLNDLTLCSACNVLHTNSSIAHRPNIHISFEICKFCFASAYLQQKYVSCTHSAT